MSDKYICIKCIEHTILQCFLASTLWARTMGGVTMFIYVGAMFSLLEQKAEGKAHFHVSGP